jgi:hypothetical protein
MAQDREQAGCSEYGNEQSGSIISRGFIDYLHDCIFSMEWVSKFGHLKHHKAS